MEKILVKLGCRAYEILIEKGLVAGAGPFGAAVRVAAIAEGARIAFVSDENVWAAGGAAFFEALARAGAGVFPVIIKPGEASKNLGGLGRLADAFAEFGLTRGGLVCAMGGGVVGDLAGFAAATWMRGVCYAQIPTSLLAMVDSSVGGKTAVDIPAGKNLVGAFHQPSLVLVDPGLLATLPTREFRSGMAEVIKYGAALRMGLFERLEKTDCAAGASSPGFDGIIADCIGIKAAIVEEDELDKGRRALLNFGHTFGHAIEAKYGFAKYTHGEAVAIGMRIAARYGEAVGITEPGTAARLCALLDAWGLTAEEGADGLIELIGKDKKAKGNAVGLILLTRIGEAAIFRTPLADVEAGLAGLAAAGQRRRTESAAESAGTPEAAAPMDSAR
ncbi:MAG: 3-dehydroquinate synthase [Clostridiales Family XIII bacterium]|jgi:3-dehydroquinate synthase|nr:3-dehydroquinate synthase [Clostridiales Family XIII bacterium]